MAYLDYNSTTPVDPRVVEAMLPAFTTHYGNPSSTHGAGADASNIVDEARQRVAALLGSGPNDVVFTSGATEANNMAIYGVGSGGRVLYGGTEHKSVIEPCLALSRKGVLDVAAIPVMHDGTINLGKLSESLKAAPCTMVCVMLANSETGVINQIREVAEVVHGMGAILHCDITQAAGKVPVNLDEMGIDIAACSSHKMYGPKGVGALVAGRFVRRSMAPLLHGGGQEGELRSGTQNVPGIVGFGKACEIAQSEMGAESSRIRGLRDMFESRLISEAGDVEVNGLGSERLPNTSNVRIRGALADAVISNSKAEISSGSACSSSTIEPSHVLLAMGLDRTAAAECVRVSIGRFTTPKDIDLAVQEIAGAAEYVRGIESREVEA